jgi:hypothetical protein
MKAMILRVGIDKGTDGVLAPIFCDGKFEYIPLSEKALTNEKKTFKNTKGLYGNHLSHYLPEKIADRKLHMDPEFETFTYGDQTRKRNYLLKLDKNDYLVFYAGLTPYNNDYTEDALYLIGYFKVKAVYDFNKIKESERIVLSKKLLNNSHIKSSSYKDLVIVKGYDDSSKLIENAILLSSKKLNKIGRNYHAVSSEMEEILGISGSIQRSIPPRFVTGQHFKNLMMLLKIKK